MSKRFSILTAAALFASLAAAPVAVAGDAQRGEEKAQVCASCHGAGGNKPIANYPKLAGQEEKYLRHSLRAYRSGARANAIMAGQAAGLSDEDINDLAAYFAAQPGDLR